MAKSEKHLTSLEKAIAQAIGDNRTLGNPNDPGRDKYPQLWSWLSTIYVGRDQLKNPAYLTVRLGPDGVNACLIDRDLSTLVEVVAGCLDDVLPVLESALSAPNCPLKSWGKREPHLRKRRPTS